MIYKNQYTNEEFKTQEECERSESHYLETQEAKAVQEKKAKAVVSKRKKELADEIESLDSKITEAEKSYEIAKEKATELIREANREAEKILKEAAKELESASEERMLKIKEWCKEFGPYSANYTGEKAAEFYKRTLGLLDPFRWFFKI